MSGDRRRSVCEYTVLVFGSLVFLMGFPHALLGWPAFSAALTEAGVATDVREGLAVGWTFGSAAMFALGTLSVFSFFQLRRGNRYARTVVLVVGAMYLVFGLGAFLWRGGKPHFLAFMLVGVGLAVPALLWRDHGSSV